MEIIKSYTDLDLAARLPYGVVVKMNKKNLNHSAYHYAINSMYPFKNKLEIKKLKEAYISGAIWFEKFLKQTNTPLGLYKTYIELEIRRYCKTKEILETYERQDIKSDFICGVHYTKRLYKIIKNTNDKGR